MGKLKELFEIIDFHYGYLVDLRNRISGDDDYLNGELDFDIRDEDHIVLDHILDVFDELKEKEIK